MFDYFDIHSHLYFPDYDADREIEIEKMKEAKIGTILIGTGVESSQKCIELAEKHSNIFACVGQHPADVKVDTEFDKEIIKLVENKEVNKKVVAIGECGLDYFRMSENDIDLKETQKKIFQSHIDLAIKVEKPLMLHIRSSKGTADAYEEALDILEKNYKKFGHKLRGNAHFFAGSPDILKRFLNLGFTVSFTGVITFTQDYDELIRQTPLDMIMSETDAPYVAPVPYRGSRNSPLYVPEVVRAIARIRGEDFEMVRKQLITNVIRNFRI